EIDRVEMIVGFSCVEMGLPGACEEFIQVIVQVAVNQRFPFLKLEPDAVAVAAAVQEKFGVGEDFVARHDMSTVGAELQLFHIPGWVDLDRALLVGEPAAQGPSPGHIRIGREKYSLAVETLCCWKPFQ